jgi:hypothetical protein
VEAGAFKVVEAGAFEVVEVGLGAIGRFLSCQNTHKFVSSNANSVIHKYATQYCSLSEDTKLLPPHILQLANNTYHHIW